MSLVNQKQKIDVSGPETAKIDVSGKPETENRCDR